MASIDRKLDEWHREGLLADDDLTAIRAYEQKQDEGIAVWQEALGYLGATLAVSAGVLLIGDFWDEFTVAAKLALIGVLVGFLTLTGYFVPADREGALRRLSSLLLAGASLAVGWFMVLFGVDLLDYEEPLWALAVGGAVAAHAGLTWRSRVLPLQQLATFGGLATMVGGLFAQFEMDPPAIVAGLVVWGAGVVWALLSWGEIVRPRVTGTVVGLLTVGVGSQIAASGDERVLGLLLGLASTVVALAVGAKLRELVWLAFGAAGIIVFVPQLVFELFADTVGAPLALLVSGVVLVATAVAGVRVKREVVDEEQAS